MTDSQPVDQARHGARSLLGGHASHAGGMPAESFTGRAAERVEDRPQRIPKGFLENSEDDLLREMRDAARVIRYSAKNVDQYQVSPVGDPGEAEVFIELASDFERLDEIIEAILVTGPPNNQFVLQLGKRTFTLFTDAFGKMVIAPIRMKLGYSDKRTLTALGVTQPAPVTPAVPGSTVAQQNTNQFPVLVALTGGTFTQVFVNGIQVGTTSLGPYLVPSGGAISITYSVAPTWTWANANANIPASGNWQFELMGRPDDPGRRY